MKKHFKLVLVLLMANLAYPITSYQEIKTSIKPSRVEIRTVGTKSLRVTLLPYN